MQVYFLIQKIITTIHNIINCYYFMCAMCLLHKIIIEKKKVWIPERLLQGRFGYLKD